KPDSRCCSSTCNHPYHLDISCHDIFGPGLLNGNDGLLHYTESVPSPRSKSDFSEEMLLAMWNASYHAIAASRDQSVIPPGVAANSFYIIYLYLNLHALHNHPKCDDYTKVALLSEENTFHTCHHTGPNPDPRP